MDGRRLLSTVALAALVGGLVATGAPPAAATSFTSYYCSDGAPSPCFVSVTRQTPGNAPVAVTSGDATWWPTVTGSSASGSNDVLWNIENKVLADPYELDTDGSGAERDNVWDAVIDMGTTAPRVSFMFGDPVAVTRHADTSGSPTSYTVEVSARPTTALDNNDCNVGTWPWTCPQTASSERAAYLGGQVSDWAAWTDDATRTSLWGLDLATNVEETSLPPRVISDPSTGVQQLVIDLANSHYHPDGTTVFQGFVHLRIPNAFLRAQYGVDDPASMTGSGLLTTYSGPGASGATGGNITIAQDDANSAMLVDATGITFSTKSLHVHRGVITPTRPTSIAAKRTAVHRGRVSFTKSRSRGSHIVGYAARCVSLDGKSTVSARGTSSPIVLTTLVRGKAYNCRVRARSKAGTSMWSLAARMARSG